MKRWMVQAGIFSILLLILALSPQCAFALSLDREKEISDLTEEFTLYELGLAENTVLLGPFDEVTLRFSLPPYWSLQSGAMLELELGSYFSSLIPNENATLPDDITIGEISVWLNGNQAGAIQLKESGSSSHTIKINEEYFMGGEKKWANELVLRWDAVAACQFGIGSSVSLLPGSKLILPHGLTSGVPDLTIFPAPFYTENNLFQAGVRLVVPDEPSVEEIQAALIIAAGLGNISGGTISVNLTPLGELTDRMTNEDHLIFIGTIDQLSWVNDTQFTNMVLDELSNVEALPQEGVIMEFASPWQPVRMLVVVSGKTGSAVIQAGLALGSGKFLSTARNDLALISGLKIPVNQPEYTLDTTFATLGHPTYRITELGMHEITIPFKAAPGKMLSPEAYLDLNLNHSKILDYYQSGLWVKLNGIAIGSVRFSDRSAETHMARFIIPPSAIQPLNNQLEIQVNMVSSNACPLPGVEDHWITIFSDSVLHLPIVDVPGELIAPLKIGDFPLPFIYAEGLQDVVFVVQEDLATTWEAAANLAFELGHQSGSNFFQPEVIFANDLDEISTQDRQLILIGKSGIIPFATGFNEFLPAPFTQDGTLKENIATSISYTGIESKSTGFLETVNFSTSPMREALLVLGNDEAGILLAVDALLDETVKAELVSGNFAIIQDGNVVSDNIRVKPALNATSEPIQAIKQNAASLRQWMIIGLGITILAVACLLVFSIVSIRSKKQQRD